MEPLSDTESEPEQFPAEPVVEEQSLEKKPKRKYVKKVKVAEPANEVIEEPKPGKFIEKLIHYCELILEKDYGRE